MNYIFSFYFFLLSSQWGLVSSTLSTFAQRDGVKKKEPVPEFVLHTAVFYRFVSAARWREEAAVFIPLDLSTPPYVVSNIRAPRGTHMFWWNTPVNCRRMRSKGGETHDLHVMVAIAEIAGLKSPARAAAMASFSALASTQVVVLGILVALVLLVIHRQTRRTTSAGGRPQESFGHHHRPRCRGGRDTGRPVGIDRWLGRRRRRLDTLPSRH